MTPFESRSTLPPRLVEGIQRRIDDAADQERERVMPGLLDEEVERALDELAYGGYDPDTARERLVPCSARLPFRRSARRSVGHCAGPAGVTARDVTGPMSPAAQIRPRLSALPSTVHDPQHQGA